MMIHEMPMRSGYGGNQQYSLDLLDRLTDLPGVVGMKEECMDGGYAYLLHRRLSGKCGIIGAGSKRLLMRDFHSGAKAYLVGIGNFFPASPWIPRALTAAIPSAPTSSPAPMRPLFRSGGIFGLAYRPEGNHELPQAHAPVRARTAPASNRDSKAPSCVRVLKNSAALPRSCPRCDCVMPDPARTLVVIPARGGSKRLPRKNVLPLGGKPLILHAVDVALNRCTLWPRARVHRRSRDQNRCPEP